jgi:hypothetical protein
MCPFYHLSCLSSSPVDSGFLYDKDTKLKETVKGSLQKIMSCDTQSDDSYRFIGRDKERNNYNILCAVS